MRAFQKQYIRGGVRQGDDRLSGSGQSVGWTTQTVRLRWDVGQAFEYLGHFMIGYVIRKHVGYGIS